MSKNSKMKKRTVIISVITFSIASLFTAKAIYSKNLSESNSSHQIKIGLSLDSLVIERWQTDRDIFVSKAKQLGAKVLVEKANNDTNEQIRQVKSLIDEGVDVLVIVPHDSSAFQTILSIAKRKGIRVIAYDRLIKDSSVDLYVSFDNEKVGELMGDALLKVAPKGNYLIINGGQEDYNTHLVNNGFKRVLKDSLDSGKIKILNEVWATSWNEEVAYRSVDEALSKGEKIDAIMCGNDRLAESAIQALAERKLAGTIPVIGQDASLGGCQRVVENTQLMTIYKPIRPLAETAAEYAVKLAKDQPFSIKNTIYDGTSDIPFYVEEPITVYKENMVSTVVKDNFHSINEIYMNVPKDSWPLNN